MTPSLLGTHSPSDFLEHYWQQKPLFLPGAVDPIASPITADELAGLALEEEVESRIVVRDHDQYAVEHGPIPEARFATLAEADWTLLVQAVDLWVPEVEAMKAWLAFLPTWRMDDVMVSYATTGGGVGPHYDLYDVFLLQVEGTREWRIGQRCDSQSELMRDSDLRVLQHFEESDRFQTGPGDVLYIPPQLAHWGIASSESLTYSFGFRAPTRAEMLADLSVELLLRDDDQHLKDPVFSQQTGDTVDPAFIDQVQQMVRALAEDRDLLEDWFLRFMTEPKYPELLEQTQEERTARSSRGVYRNGRRVE